MPKPGVAARPGPVAALRTLNKNTIRPARRRRRRRLGGRDRGGALRPGVRLSGRPACGMPKHGVAARPGPGL